jgi:hypothetical protein
MEPKGSLPCSQEPANGPNAHKYEELHIYEAGMSNGLSSTRYFTKLGQFYKTKAARTNQHHSTHHKTVRLSFDNHNRSIYRTTHLHCQQDINRNQTEHTARPIKSHTISAAKIRSVQHLRERTVTVCSEITPHTTRVFLLVFPLP